MEVKKIIHFALKVIILHTLTYFVFGLIMSRLFNYGHLFESDIIRDFMRPIDSPLILAGPFLQPVRGLLFAIGIWPLRKIIFDTKNGWLILWNIIFIFGILSTPAAAPCSVEGLIYTKLPLWFHLIGLPEILLQTLFFSFLLFKWVNKINDNDMTGMQNIKFKQFKYLGMVIMVACFAYIGYAIGGILSALLVGRAIRLPHGSTGFSGQYMFIVAFFVNMVAIYFLSKAWLSGKIRFPLLFFIFWIIDSLILIAYQFVFSNVMPVHLAILMGFFPALIIIMSLYLNRNNFRKLI